MSPEVEAAIIAGGVGVLTVIVALFGTRKTSQDTRDGLNKQLTEQREALDRTLKEQRKALDKTLAEQRTQTLNERFATAAGQLGSDRPPAVRLAGVYAMAGLADDWEEGRQTCVDVLCAYLRLPYARRPGADAPPEELLEFRASRVVRRTVIRVITAHLKVDAEARSWQQLNFNFIGAKLDGGNFADAKFCGSVDFGWTAFSGDQVDFSGVEFSAGRVNFGSASFTSRVVDFSDAKFSGAAVSFRAAKFIKGAVGFKGASFTGGEVDFSRAQFGDEATLNFSAVAAWSHPPRFDWDSPPPGVKLPRPAGGESQLPP
jgi:hypothetical protein